METRKKSLLKVLNLEDDPEDAEMLKHYLHQVSDPRFFVTHLTRSSEASLYLAFEDYDVVICDFFLHMADDPHSTCERFVREVRRNRPEVVVVVTTGDADFSHISPWLQAMIRAGQVGFLFKHDWGPRNLMRVIERTAEEIRLPMTLSPKSAGTATRHPRDSDPQPGTSMH